MFSFFFFCILDVVNPIIYWQVMLALGDFMSVQCHACIGGTNIGEDIRKLDYGQHIVSGTPGRVFGACKYKSLILSWLRNRMLTCYTPTSMQCRCFFFDLCRFEWRVIDLLVFREALIVNCPFKMSFAISPLSYLSTDMIKRRNLRTRSIKLFILDEADEMLNKGMISGLRLCL